MYSESLQNCVYLLNKYRWMAGDTSNPEVKCKAEKERKITVCRPLTEQERQLIISLHNEGLNYKTIVQKSGRAYAVIRRVLDAAGVKRRVIYTHMDQQTSDKIRELWLQGMTPYKISETLGLPSTTVASKVKKFGSRSSAGSPSTSAARSGQ